MPTFDSADNGRITIGFSFTDQLGNMYSNQSSVEVFYDMDENELDVIGRQLDAFLKQCGYYRKNNNILMESLSDDEYDAVTSFLWDYRNERASPDEDEPHIF